MFQVPVAIKIVTAGEDGRPDGLDPRNAKRHSTFPPRTSRSWSGSTRTTSSSRKSSFPKERDELLYQLEHDDVIGRMDAAAGLLAFKDDPRTAAALVASVRNDPFWAVRKSSLEALARLKDKSGPAVL